MYRSEDYIQQLADHIKTNLKKGYTIEALTVSLINQGYSRISVEKAIELANQQLAASAPEMKEKPQISYKIEPEIPVKKSFWKTLKDWFR
jgi:hypothetical protein